MKKDKLSFKERLKKANNPLKHVSKRDLLITLLCVLICVSIGFGFGFGCAKSCERVEASADVLSVPVRPGIGQDDSSNAYQYVFNYYIDSYLFTANFVFYKHYTPNYLTTTHVLALADNNNYSPYEYVTQQLYEYTSEEDYLCLEFAPGDTNVEYELHYTFYDEEYSPKWQYTEDTYYNFYTVHSYSNLEQGGFNSDFSYLLTFSHGFGFVLKNGSWWGVQLKNNLYGNFGDYLTLGLGTIYTYDDLFGINTSDDIYLEGFENGYLSGYTDGYSDGLVDGRAEEYPIAFEEGYDNGYVDGYNNGLQVNFEDITPWDTIVGSVNSFLQIEVIPNVTFSMIFQLTFGLLLLGFAIKIFLGG